jgi:glycine/D-amino acid oxidase-like deaminating enzyme
MARALGVRFRFDTRIERLAQAAGRVSGVHTSAGLLTA